MGDLNEALVVAEWQGVTIETAVVNGNDVKARMPGIAFRFKGTRGLDMRQPQAMTVVIPDDCAEDILPWLARQLEALRKRDSGRFVDPHQSSTKGKGATHEDDDL